MDRVLPGRAAHRRRSIILHLGLPLVRRAQRTDRVVRCKSKRQARGRRARRAVPRNSGSPCRKRHHHPRGASPEQRGAHDRRVRSRRLGSGALAGAVGRPLRPPRHVVRRRRFPRGGHRHRARRRHVERSYELHRLRGDTPVIVRLAAVRSEPHRPVVERPHAEAQRGTRGRERECRRPLGPLDVSKGRRGRTGCEVRRGQAHVLYHDVFVPVPLVRCHTRLRRPVRVRRRKRNIRTHRSGRGVPRHRGEAARALQRRTHLPAVVAHHGGGIRRHRAVLRHARRHVHPADQRGLRVLRHPHLGAVRRRIASTQRERAAYLRAGVASCSREWEREPWRAGRATR